MPLIYFEVYCAKCGEGLCKYTTVNEKSGVKLEIEPCPVCLKNAVKDGFNKGPFKSVETIKQPAER